MKLFKLTMGSIEKFAVAKNEKEMFEKRAEVEAAFEYTPVQIDEVTLPGYEITVKAIKTALYTISTAVKRTTTDLSITPLCSATSITSRQTVTTPTLLNH